MAVINDYNIRRVVDIYGSVQDRDLGGVGRDVKPDRRRQPAPAAARQLHQRPRPAADDARVVSWDRSIGLGFAIVLVYLLIVVNFQSWLDPLIIITALPAALAGIVLFLFVTHTTLSVPALMGTIMCMGVVTANSILVVSFAKERLLEHGDPVAAAIEAGVTRFRPVLMTALAMIIGMVPMALALGEGGEQNAPLGRAVIGGLLLRHRRHAGVRAGGVQRAPQRRVGAVARRRTMKRLSLPVAGVPRARRRSSTTAFIRAPRRNRG